MLPLDDLLPECLDYLKSLGSASTKLSEILSSKDSIVYGAIETAIHRVNQKAQSNAAKVQSFTILPADFSLPSGELGPTLKLRRPEILKKYHQEIENMYKVEE